MNTDQKEINQPWHIPRASLSGSTGSTSAQSNMSHSNASSVKYPTRTRRSNGHKNRGYVSDGDDRHSPRDIAHHPNGSKYDSEVGGVKRSSQSSQGSTDSNHSSHSASSGSMLLTAANLEQLAQIHKKNALNHPPHGVERLTTYNANITSVAASVAASAIDGPPSSAIISIDQLMLQRQHQRLHGGGKATTKDVDSVSLASSTHFTMVNGVGGPQRKTKSGLCDRGHQITVLILTMSMVFFIGICGAVFLLELRAQKMPH